MQIEEILRRMTPTRILFAVGFLVIVVVLLVFGFKSIGNMNDSAASRDDVSKTTSLYSDEELVTAFKEIGNETFHVQYIAESIEQITVGGVPSNYISHFLIGVKNSNGSEFVIEVPENIYESVEEGSVMNLRIGESTLPIEYFLTEDNQVLRIQS